MVRAYAYQRLSSDHSIRLLRLYGAADLESQVECDVFEADLLAELPAFEAISYTWQGQLPSRKIHCAGEPLLVTEDSFAILSHLRPRQTDTHRLVWIDSVCIDQAAESVAKRSNKVALMRDVYKAAERVLVWLIPKGISGKTHERNLRVRGWLDAVACTAAMPESDEGREKYVELIDSAITAGRSTILDRRFED